MFEVYSTATEARGDLPPRNSVHHQYNVQVVNQLYERLLFRGQLVNLVARLTRKPRGLLPLAAIEEQCRVRARHSVPSLQTIPLGRIRGTEGRPGGFDHDFYPLQAHTANRWKSVAMAWLSGVRLPPVLLIQVDETYYVRDGHHRVSVLRACGVDYIEASVTRWEVEEVAPCPAHATIGCFECVPSRTIA